jgi:4-hydroxy-2-oxoheptanedioate aldolase
VIDAEHGTIQPAECQNMVRAAEVRGVTPIARVTTNLPHIILRFMDTGLAGVHVPWVNSAEEAERAVQSVKYHPRGVRGLAGSRAADYGQTMPLAEYIQQANEETLVVIHIETEEAANQIEDFLAVPDIDVIFIGPTDLSHSMGITGQKDHPRLQAAIDHVVDAVQQTDIAFGSFVGSAADAEEWKGRGARYLATGLEAIIKTASRDYLARLRG